MTWSYVFPTWTALKRWGLMSVSCRDVNCLLEMFGKEKDFVVVPCQTVVGLTRTCISVDWALARCCGRDGREHEGVVCCGQASRVPPKQGLVVSREKSVVARSRAVECRVRGKFDVPFK